MKLRWLALAPIVASCTFPSVTYDDGGAPMDATLETSTDDVVVEASDDGGVVPEAQDDGNDPCDLDHDTYRSTKCEGGTDCNDNDNRVNPAAGFVLDVPDGYPNGDWNCDGKIDMEFPVISCGLTGCSDTLGFASTTECGQTGNWETCTGLCSKSADGTNVQGCR
jgi:hypothetical protein